MATWSLVATVKAPEEKVLAFAAYHLSLGADHLWLYLDDPEQPVPALLASHPRVTVTLCDEAHWARVGKKRPPPTRTARLRTRAMLTGNSLPRTGSCTSTWTNSS